MLENSDLELTSYALGGSWLGRDGFLGAAVSRFETQYGVPHAHGEPPPGAPPGWMGLGGVLEAVNLRIGVNDYEHVDLEGQDIGTRFLNDSYEGRADGPHLASGANG